MAGADHVRPLSLERETTIRPLPLPASAHAAYTVPLVWSTPELAKLSVRSGTKFEKVGDGELKVTGDLTIHGVTRPVVLNVEGPAPEGKDPWGNIRSGASGTTKIKRSDFGLTWNAVLETGGILVGDEVKIELDVELTKAQSTAA